MPSALWRPLSSSPFCQPPPASSLFRIRRGTFHLVVFVFVTSCAWETCPPQSCVTHCRSLFGYLLKHHPFWWGLPRLPYLKLYLLSTCYSFLVLFFFVLSHHLLLSFCPSKRMWVLWGQGVSSCHPCFPSLSKCHAHCRPSVIISWTSSWVNELFSSSHLRFSSSLKFFSSV